MNGPIGKEEERHVPRTGSVTYDLEEGEISVQDVVEVDLRVDPGVAEV